MPSEKQNVIIILKSCTLCVCSKVPCAVCMTVSHCSLLMITFCPVNGYVGNLMSGGQHHTIPTTMNVLTKAQSLFQNGMVLAGVLLFSLMLKPPAMGWPVLHMLLGES